MEYIKCALCNADRHILLYKASDADHITQELFSLVKCRNCGLVYINPRLTKDEYDKFYYEEYYGPTKIFFNYLMNVCNRIILLSKTRKIEMFKKRGCILDFGCGNGNFLFAMRKRGWETYGVEPCQSILRKLGNDNIKSNLEEFQFPDKYFDVITLWHVFEHLLEPKKILRNLHRFLNEDGILFIALPNFHSLEARISKKKWFHLDLPRHSYHYSPETITRMLDKTGFKIIKVCFFNWAYNSFSLFQTPFNLFGCELNFFYSTFKRNFDYRDILSPIKYIYNVSITIILFIPLAFISLFGSYFLSCFGKSGSIEVFCQKKKK